MDSSSIPSDGLKVLIVEDDPHVRLGCVQALQLAGIEVDAVDSVEAALPLLAPGWPGAVVTDMRLPGADGLQLVQHCHTMDAALPVIMITGHGDVSLAVQAMRAGAYDFVQKPFAPELLVETVRRALERRGLTMEVAGLRAQLERRSGVEAKLIGRSPAMAEVRALVANVAASPVDVLIRGETGCGKELIAQALHELSGRSGPFVALNCGGMPDNLLDSELFGHEPGAFTGAQKRRIGKIEHANGGTLFLDELESMPMPMQVKLLRVLQERVLERLGGNQAVPVDCRIVAATKDNLLERANDKTFRADLYYRLNVVTIDLPPLRERREDIPLLLQHFVLLAAARFNRPPVPLRPDQLARLMGHDWPGNVRELRNVADCLVLGLRSDVLGQPGTPEATGGLAEAVDRFERTLVETELQRQQGNVTRAAEVLKVGKTTLHDKIRKWKIGPAG
jgi:two-component system C4-dicarboxylate transport response regulator DctD